MCVLLTGLGNAWWGAVQKQKLVQGQLRDADVTFKLCRRSSILPEGFRPPMRQRMFTSAADERCLDPDIMERSEMIRKARGVAQDVMNGTALPKRTRPREGKSILERIACRRTAGEAAATEARGTAAPRAEDPADGGIAAEVEAGSMWDGYVSRKGAAEARRADAGGTHSSTGMGAGEGPGQPGIRRESIDWNSMGMGGGGGLTGRGTALSVPVGGGRGAGGGIDGLGSGVYSVGAAGAPFLTQ